MLEPEVVLSINSDHFDADEQPKISTALEHYVTVIRRPFAYYYLSQ